MPPVQNPISKKSILHFLFSIFALLALSIFFFSLALTATVSAAQPNLLWVKEECLAKCAQIKQEALDKIDAKITEIKSESPVDEKKLAQAQASRAQVEKINAADTVANNGCAGPDDGKFCECYAPATPVNLEMPIGATVIANGLVNYIIAIYEWGVRIAALVAIIMLMFAGVQWLTAAGSQGAITKAKERIKNAIAGLVLLLGSYYILDFISPKLTQLTGLEVKMVPTIAQGTFFCQDMPEGTHIQDAEKKEVKLSDAECTQKYTTLLGNTTCNGRLCKDQKKVCGSKSGQTILSCYDPQELCSSYSKDKNCEQANYYLKGFDYVCALQSAYQYNTACFIAKRSDYFITVPGGGYEEGQQVTNPSQQVLHPDLAKAVACIKAQFNEGEITVWSGTDSYVGINEARLEQCCKTKDQGCRPCEGKRDPKKGECDCLHMCRSAHYGCGGNYMAYAADLGPNNKEKLCRIIIAANKCKDASNIVGILGPPSNAFANYCPQAKGLYRPQPKHEDHIHVSVKNPAGVW